MNNYTIYCTYEQTKKALELGAPITGGAYYYKICIIDDDEYATPTAEQMRGWLIDKLKATTFANKHYSCGDKEGYGYLIIGAKCILELDSSDNSEYLLNTDEEATLAAIDAALDYLEKQKEDKEPLTKLEDSKIDSKESTAYTYEQMATLNLQLQGLVNSKDEAYNKIKAENEYLRMQLCLIRRILNN